MITGNIKKDWNNFKTGFGNFFSNAQDVWDSLLFGKTNKTNKQVAEQNLDFQREQLDYEKGLQQQIFNREDTSYQRTAKDMRAAGLNPLSMNSTNGAGETIAMNPMNNSYEHTSQGIMQAVNAIFNNALQFKTTQSNYTLNQAQANLINAQAENQKIKNLYEADNLNLDNLFKKIQNDSAYWDNKEKSSNYLFHSNMGWTSNMPDWLKYNSAKFGYKPFNHDFNLKQYNNYLNNDGFGYIYPGKITGSKGIDTQELAQKIISDQLLTGMLSIFGKLF